RHRRGLVFLGPPGPFAAALPLAPRPWDPLSGSLLRPEGVASFFPPGTASPTSRTYFIPGMIPGGAPPIVLSSHNKRVTLLNSSALTGVSFLLEVYPEATTWQEFPRQLYRALPSRARSESSSGVSGGQPRRPTPSTTSPSRARSESSSGVSSLLGAR